MKEASRGRSRSHGSEILASVPSGGSLCEASAEVISLLPFRSEAVPYLPSNCTRPSIEAERGRPSAGPEQDVGKPDTSPRRNRLDQRQKNGHPVVRQAQEH